MVFLNRFMVVLFLVSIGASRFCFADEGIDMLKAFEISYDQEKATNYTNAIASLKKVYSENSYQVNARLGWLLYCAGQYAESIKYYLKANALMPYSEESKFGIIYPLAALGNWDDVVSNYKQILSNSPNNTVALSRLGTIYYNREDYKNALPNFKKVVELYPFDCNALLLYGWTSLKLGKTREAEVLFTKALLCDPKSKSAQEGLDKVTGKRE